MSHKWRFLVLLDLSYQQTSSMSPNVYLYVALEALQAVLCWFVEPTTSLQF